MQVCSTCNLRFCSSCFSPVLSLPSLHRCKVCQLKDFSVIERAHLTPLSLIHLKYYTKRKGISSPINVVQEDIIAIILARQAKDLSDRTKRALTQLNGTSENCSFEHIDRLIEEPYVSTYSLAGERVPHAEFQSRASDDDITNGWQYVISGNDNEMTTGREAGRGGGLPASGSNSSAATRDTITVIL